MNTLYQIVGFAVPIGFIVTVMTLSLAYKHFKKKYKQRQYRTYWKNALINNKETWR